MQKTIDVICEGCGKTFQKDFIEYRRRSYKKKKMYCSNSCYGKHTAKHHLPEGMGEKYKGNLIPNNLLDEYSPFRYYLRQARMKHKKYGDNDLTASFLKRLWEKQAGICPYTGFKMELPATTLSHHNTPYCASLDRIDPSKGYMQDNVEFVCLFVNYAKNTFSKEDILLFINKLVEMKRFERLS